MKKLIAYFTLSTLFINSVFADEGMWLLMYLKKMNETEMKARGMKISADDIYDVNNTSIKDAIISFGGFCTGEIISKEGLILTNHHCGYDAIATHSTVEHDYLTNGFWAYEKSQELPCEGLYAKFLVRMENVTEKINTAAEGKNGAEKETAIKTKIAELKKASIEGTKYDADIKSFFEGNEYYLFIYETYNDVRFVGAPPSSIGKFGGDTDNWMWPRHTGDFSLFRIYANAEGKPAAYSKDNIPFKPKHYLPLSIKGVKKDDFAMVLGYPGATNRFLSSYGVKTATDIDQPARVKVRQKKLETMKADMDKSDAVRIMYSSKYAQISNYWKYFIGQSRGLKRLKVYERKQEEEKKMQAWINADDKRKSLYGNVISDIATANKAIESIALPSAYFQEGIFGIEHHAIFFALFGLQKQLEAKADKEAIKALTDGLKPKLDDYFKSHNAATDQKVYGEMLTLYYQDVPKEYHPKTLEEVYNKNKKDFKLFAQKYYAKSIFLNQEKLKLFLEKPDLKAFQKDPSYILFQGFLDVFQTKVQPIQGPSRAQLKSAMKLYIDCLRKMNTDKFYAPDANSTMRCTYGNVLDYSPADAMIYDYISTIDGIIQKEDPKNEEFIVPAKLKELYLKKDYGRYGMNGTLPVAFLSNTDITGGNSGSPVINGNGELIGTAFDGNWEAMSGDIAFEPTLQRTISVDIRYTLFIIEKFAGAVNLIKEMTIIE